MSTNVKPQIPANRWPIPNPRTAVPVSLETVMKWHTAGIPLKLTRVAAGYLVQFR